MGSGAGLIGALWSCCQEAGWPASEAEKVGVLGALGAPARHPRRPKGLRLGIWAPGPLGAPRKHTCGERSFVGFHRVCGGTDICPDRSVRGAFRSVSPLPRPCLLPGFGRRRKCEGNELRIDERGGSGPGGRAAGACVPARRPARRGLSCCHGLHGCQQTFLAPACTPLLTPHACLGTPWPHLSHRLQEPRQSQEAQLPGATCTSQLEHRCAEQAESPWPQSPDGLRHIPGAAPPGNLGGR